MVVRLFSKRNKSTKDPGIENEGNRYFSGERRPFMLCFVVFLQCPLVTEPNIVAHDKRNVYRVQLQRQKVGQIRVNLEVRGNKLMTD